MKIIFDEFQIEITAARDSKSVLDKIRDIMETPAAQTLIEQLSKFASVYDMPTPEPAKATRILNDVEKEIIWLIDSLCLTDTSIIDSDNALVKELKEHFSDYYVAAQNAIQSLSFQQTIMAIFGLLPANENPLTEYIDSDASVKAGYYVATEKGKSYVDRLEALFEFMKTDNDETEEGGARFEAKY